MPVSLAVRAIKPKISDNFGCGILFFFARLFQAPVSGPFAGLYQALKKGALSWRALHHSPMSRPVSVAGPPRILELRYFGIRGWSDNLGLA